MSAEKRGQEKERVLLCPRDDFQEFFHGEQLGVWLFSKTGHSARPRIRLGPRIPGREDVSTHPWARWRVPGEGRLGPKGRPERS